MMASSIKSIELVHSVDADNPVLHDMRLINGRISFFEGANAIAQKCKTSLWFFMGEWYQDQNEGFPYFQEVLIKDPSIISVKELFRSTIQKIPGVAKVDSLDLDLDDDTRHMDVTFSCTTDDAEKVTNYRFVVE